MKKIKLCKNSIAVAVASNAVMSTVALAEANQTTKVADVPASLFVYLVMFGGFAVMSYRDIKKYNEERLYDLISDLIPNQKKVIKTLKKKTKKDNLEYRANHLKIELESEKNFLRYLEEEESRLCQNLNLDQTSEEEIRTFINEMNRKMASKEVKKSKIKRIFAK